MSVTQEHAEGTDVVRPTSQRPIFIVGCPRSGTTLVQLMLHAHPEIAIPPENRFLLELYDRREHFGDLREETNRRRLSHFIVKRPSTKVRDYGLKIRATQRRIVNAPPTIGSAAREVFRSYAERFGKRRWGDKRPAYIQRLDVILRMFPDAQIIHVIRDGRDCVSSLKQMPWWSGGSIVAIWTWRNAINKGVRARRRLPSDAYLEVRYEDLVADPEAQARRMCTFLGEPFDPAMLQPQEVAAVAVPERKVWHTRTREEINDAALERWRDDLEPWELDLIECVAARQLRLHGYALSRGRRPLPPVWALARFIVLHARRTVRRLGAVIRDARRTRRYPLPVATQDDAPGDGAAAARDMERQAS